MAMAHSFAMLLAAAWLCACAPQPVMESVVTQQAAGVVHQDVEFARGCWSQRDAWGLVVQTFSLLPPHGASSQTLDGQLEKHSRSSGILRSAPYSVRRDGGALILEGSPARVPGRSADELKKVKLSGPVMYRIAEPPADAPRIISTTSRRAVFQGPAGWTIFEGQGDRLVLFLLRDTGHAISIFDGRRELCEWSQAAIR